MGRIRDFIDGLRKRGDRDEFEDWDDFDEDWEDTSDWAELGHGWGKPEQDPLGDEDVRKAVENMFKGFQEQMERIQGMPPEKVVFSGPCTIAIWPSGLKVIARCQDGDEYDREKGLMMCLLKRVYGSKAVDVLDQWC